MENSQEPLDIEILRYLKNKSGKRTTIDEIHKELGEKHKCSIREITREVELLHEEGLIKALDTMQGIAFINDISGDGLRVLRSYITE